MLCLKLFVSSSTWSTIRQEKLHTSERIITAMERKKVKYTLVEFGGCLHAFTRPDKIHERDREQGRWCEHAHSVFKDDFSRTSPIAKFEPLRYHWQLEYLADTPKQTFPTAVIFACTYHYQLRRGTTMIFADLFLPAFVDFTRDTRQHTTTFASSSACLRLPAISYPIYVLLADD